MGDVVVVGDGVVVVVGEGVWLDGPMSTPGFTGCWASFDEFPVRRTAAVTPPAMTTTAAMIAAMTPAPSLCPPRPAVPG